MSYTYTRAALALGQFLKSPQTNLLHLFHSKDLQEHHTVPLFENLCYSLALLRSKEIDNIESAGEIIERCLSFQTKQGSFPRYMHEYPLDHLYLNCIDILNTLYWIGREFKKVLPAELKKKIDRAKRGLIRFGDKKKVYFPPSSMFRFEILKKAIEKKEVDLASLFKKSFLTSKDGLKDVFLALQVYDPENKKDMSHEIWKDATELFNKSLLIYTGPMDNIFQNKYKLDWHLSDLFFLSLFKEEKNIDGKDPVILSSALIHPILNIDIPKEQERSILTFQTSGARWHCLKEKNLALCCLEKVSKVDKAKAGMHLFRLSFGSSSFSNSLCSQHFEGDFSSKVILEGAEMEFVLPEKIEEDELELKLFIENVGCRILVNGVKATSFTFGDILSIKNGGLALNLNFELEDPNSKFCGHILRGNRPSQIASKKDKCKAYDYVIALRTVYRTSHPKIKLRMSFL